MYKNNSFVGYLGFIFWLTLLPNLGGAVLAGDSPVNPDNVGRNIYRTGADNSSTQINATLAMTGETVPASNFPCANCHGQEGEGKVEGGLTIPAINAKTLADVGYNQTTLITAITQGMGVHHQPLEPMMPRYHLTGSQSSALLTYLNYLGTAKDVVDGITDATISVVTLLPLTGPHSETGHLFKATLEACIAELNAQPLYGRQLKLSVVDSGVSKDELMHNAKRLLIEKKPFVLLAPYLPNHDSPELYTLLEQNKIPVIAPLTFMSDQVTQPSFFFFLPSYADQVKALMGYWLDQNKKANVKLGIVFSNQKNAAIVLNIQGYLKTRHVASSAVMDITYLDGKSVIKQLDRLSKKRLDAVLLLADKASLQEVLPTLSEFNSKPTILGLLTILETEITPKITNKILLASPFALKDQTRSAFADKLGRHKVNVGQLGLQQVICAGVEFVGEGLKRAGKKLTSAKFIQALNEVNNVSIANLPALNFSPTQRTGLAGAYILTLNPSNGQPGQVSEWITSQ